MRRAATALRLLPRAIHAFAQDTFGASCTAPRQWSHHQAGFSGRAAQRAPPFDSAPSAPQRGFAAESSAQATDAAPAQFAERALRNFPSLGRAALPGRGRGNVNAAMEEAPEQYTVLANPITERYPKPPPQRVFAVVELGPTQFKVAVDDMIVSERLRGVHVNERISLNRVLMMGTPAETQIGRPLLHNVTVIAAVEEQFQDGKVLIFKKRRRKNSRRLNGHRQDLTTLRILEIVQHS